MANRKTRVVDKDLSQQLSWLNRQRRVQRLSRVTEGGVLSGVMGVFPFLDHDNETYLFLWFVLFCVAAGATWLLELMHKRFLLPLLEGEMQELSVLAFNAFFGSHSGTYGFKAEQTSYDWKDYNGIELTKVRITRSLVRSELVHVNEGTIRRTDDNRIILHVADDYGKMTDNANVRELKQTLLLLQDGDGS